MKIIVRCLPLYGPKLKILYFLAFFMGFYALELQAERISVTHPLAAISVELPEGFNMVGDRSNSAVLLAVNKASQFPSFNVVGMASNYDQNRAISALTKEILDSYKGVGITSAQVVRSARVPLRDGEGFGALLKYQNQDKNFLSQITIVPAQGRHFILTYIDQEESFDAGAAIKIAQSFESDHPLANPVSKGAASLPGWSYLVLAFVVLALLLRYIRRTKYVQS